MPTWFSENVLKGNTDKCHLIVSFKVPIDIQISDTEVNRKSKVTFMRIYVDNRFHFDYQVSQLFKKAI